MKKTYINLTFRKGRVLDYFFIVWAILFSIVAISDTSTLARSSSFSDVIYLVKHLIFAPFILFIFLHRVSSKIVGYVFIFSLYFLFSLYFGEFNVENIFSRLTYPFFLIFGFLYLKTENKQVILKVIFITSIVTIFVLTLLHIINDVPMERFTNRHRASLGFKLAHFPVIVATLVIMLDYIKISKKIKVVFGVMAIVFIIFSYTRSALVVLIIFYLHRISKDNGLLKVGLILLMCLFSLLIGLLSFEFYDELNEISSGRIYLWKEALISNFKIESLLIGSGNEVSHIWEHKNRVDVNVVHFDNSFIDIVIKMGVVGLALSFYIFYIFSQYKKMNFILLILLILGALGSVLFSTGNFIFPVLMLLLLSSKYKSIKRSAE